MTLKNINNLITYFIITTLFYVRSDNVLDSSQDTTVKSNPIIYTELFFGLSGGRAGGLGLGFEGNYQSKNNLFSARYVGNVRLDNTGFISPFIPIPNIQTSSTAEEFSILYGYRKAFNGHGFSVSGGLSRNKYTFYGEDGSNNYKRDYYLGIPFELNYQFFNRVKKRIYIYGIIPISKPTAWGSGFGIKAIGNISRNPYLGLALSCGLGYFKKY